MQKKIILFLIVLFILSSTWLFHSSNNFLDPNNGKNWWSVYFSDPKSNDLTFTIENHSNNNNFKFEILSDKEKIKEDEINIKKGEIYSINEKFEGAYKSKKITVRVITGNETKEIYKNL